MSASRAKSPATVAAFFAALDHPLKAALRAACSAIRGTSAAIREGIKWNAPSYFIGDGAYFATASIHTRGKAPESVLVVLHRGAKPQAGRVALDDPKGLVEWLGPDRGAVRFTSLADVRRKRAAFQAIIRLWVQQV